MRHFCKRGVLAAGALTAVLLMVSATAPALAHSGDPGDSSGRNPVPSAHAPGAVSALLPGTFGPGWDFVGEGPFLSEGNGVYGTGWARSHGNNFRTCVTTGSTTSHPFELWEYDPDNPDEYVGVGTRAGSGCIDWLNISAWVDGSDGTAEFYLLTTDSRATTARFYD
ncbi:MULTISPECIES: hypothetical protein [unclassified Streptomyces]|uniref:hypothetical protein n=1 Tax=unclassified Streptomyces TaxID=2593676 RepID=UPI00380F31C7